MNDLKIDRHCSRILVVDDTSANLLAESVEGCDRMQQIVTNLKSFARQNGDTITSYDINEGLESTLNIAWNELKYKAEVRIATRLDNGFVTVPIEDTGCGIPADTLARIFEPFFTTKDVGKGTGLGLSIAYEIVKNHHGEISVESEVGRGTRFVVHLPVQAVSNETGEEERL
ncbi:MAG: ATP-binding protein [Desulfuromonadaceae bacterium]